LDSGGRRAARPKFDLFSADLASGSVTALTQQTFYECSHISTSADGKQIILSISTHPEGDHFLILPIGEPVDLNTHRLAPVRLRKPS
jgi:hypothetical protein